MTDLTEFNKFELMLKDAGIEYVRDDDGNFDLLDWHQIRSSEEENWNRQQGWFSVICHFGSYGYDRGLLEFWGDFMNDPIGYLTAEECFEKLKEMLEKVEKLEMAQERFENGNRG